MDRQQHVDKLLTHYEEPRHHGALPNADIVVPGGNPVCGDAVTIYLIVNEANVAEAVHFEGEGCIISQAATSILLDMVQGKTLAEIEAIDYNDLLEILGREIVMTRVRCATLGLSTLKSAVQQYYGVKERVEKSR